MTSDSEIQAADILRKLDREKELITKLNREKPAETKSQGRVPVVPVKPDVWKSLDAEYRVARLESGMRKMLRAIAAGSKVPDLSPEYCEQAYNEEQRAEQQAAARQRALDVKSKADVDEATAKVNLETLDKIRPALRILQPKGWSKDQPFELTEKGILQGFCDNECGFRFAFNVPANMARLMGESPRAIFWTLTHRHKFKSGKTLSGGIRIGNSVGIYVDPLALTCMATGEPVRFGPVPADVEQARPLI